MPIPESAAVQPRVTPRKGGAAAALQFAGYVRRGRVERRLTERLGVQVPAFDDDDLAAVEEHADL